MNILIPDSWLHEYLKTKASAKQIAESLTLCSQSVEKITKIDGDFVYEIEITTNRSDCLSVYGIARELAVILPRFGTKAKLKPINEEKLVIPKIEKSLPLKVKIGKNSLCPRFTAIIFDNINLKSSPKIIQERLKKSGIRPLNNVVDISNYLMLELGQPMHTFDYDKIKGAKMILRESAGGEKLTTLDGQIRPLPDGSIIIEDGQGRIIDLCGIMGGKNSAVDENTKKVLLFVQTYNPMKIRTTCQKLGFRTEASSRFEKGVDPEGVISAMKKAISLFEKNCGARVASNLIDIYPNPPKTKIITLTQEKLNLVLGILFNFKEARKILESLGFETQLKANHCQLTAKVPHWRNEDIAITEDLVEEVARIYGYHNLPAVLPTGKIPTTFKNQVFDWEDKIKDLLKYSGFVETVNYSLVSTSLLEKIGYRPDNCLKINNPLTEDWVYLRPSLIPSILPVINLNQPQEANIKIFEMANIYLPQANNELPQEIPTLTAAVTGQSYPQLKGVLEKLLNELGIKNAEYIPYALQKTLYGKIFWPGRVAEIVVKNTSLGVIGEVKPVLNLNFGIKEPVVIVDLDLQELTKLANSFKKYHPIPKFPATNEDLSFVVSPKTPVGDLIKSIKSTSTKITNVELFDSYKNVRSFRITYQSQNKTLTGKEVEIIRKKIIEKIKNKFRAEIKA